MIEQDTVRLLRECDAGIKMGLSSISDVLSHVRSDPFSQRLSRCKAAHEQLQEDIQRLLGQYSDAGKEPNPIARGMSRLKTGVKLFLEDSDAAVAELMTDGCRMGVRSLRRYLEQYKAASEPSKDLTKRLIRLEEQLAADIRPYLPRQ